MRKRETTRELDARWSAIPLGEKKSILRWRNKLARRWLRPRLVRGDRLRANKAECNAREANFVFYGWDGGWILSQGGSSIAPASVYSINGAILRL